MKTIYNYNDYHLFIKDFYEEKKQEEFYFSYLHIALKLDLDLFEVVDIFSGEIDIPTEKVDEFISFFEFDNIEKAYFKRLVYIEETKTNTAYTADTINTLFSPYRIAS